MLKPACAIRSRVRCCVDFGTDQLSFESNLCFYLESYFVEYCKVFCTSGSLSDVGNCELPEHQCFFFILFMT